jgi:hypothetical protein
MRTPTIEQVEHVLGKFELVRERATKKGALLTERDSAYRAGQEFRDSSVHSVAGWYVVANLDRKVVSSKVQDGFISHFDAAEILAQDLGFNSSGSLMLWAERNPKIWYDLNEYPPFGNKENYGTDSFDIVTSKLQLFKAKLVKLKKNRLKNPTVEQVERVIKKLESVKNKANKEGAFDMQEARVCGRPLDTEELHECGTVHCASGWYAVANFRRAAIRAELMKGLVGYEDGANLMARDLGFENRHDLIHWAEHAPEIWNNLNGHNMLIKEDAYDNPGFDGVIAQWKIVKQNLIELEEEY